MILSRIREPVATIADQHRQGVWATTLRAYKHLLEARLDHTHHLILQDDLIPSLGFCNAIESFTRERPERITSIFSFKRKLLLTMQQKGIRWSVSPNVVYGGSTILPAAVSAEFLEFAATLRPDYEHDDSALAMFLREAGYEVYMCAPNLLQHLGHSSSLLGHNNRTHVSAYFAPDASRIDYTEGLDDPIRAPGFTWSHAREMEKAKRGIVMDRLAGRTEDVS